MLLPTTISLVCFLSFTRTESPPFRESRNSRLQHSNYYSSHDGRDKSYGKQLQTPPVVERDSQHDLWRSHGTAFNQNQNDRDDDLPIKNYSYLNAHESSRPAMAVFRTRGKGKALVMSRGETVYVPNELSRKKAHKGTITVRVVDRNENEVKTSKNRGGCRECPSDQTVIATKGKTFVILPEPCPLAPRMWNHISGPKPGSEIQEGVHTIRGSIGPKKKFCEYRYEVKVNRCQALKPKEKDTTLECSAKNVWGSICIVSCGPGKEPLGATDMECKEDLKWSNPIPTCKSTGDCLSPKIRPKSKISCQAADMSPDGEYLPNGTTCKLKRNGKSIAIVCKDGRWLKSRKPLMSKQSKQPNSQTREPEESKNDACNPNPCQNGGTCLRPKSNKDPPICKCMPQTQGARCELRECYYNICENDGLCIYQNEERTCYCSSAFSGDRCENYAPH